MKKDNLQYLEDIATACEKILSYTNGMEIAEFSSESLVQDAVVRNLIVIGEAAAKFTKDFVESNDTFPVKEAVTMRNKIVHDYDFVDYQVVWETVVNDIPQLLKATRKLLPD